MMEICDSNRKYIIPLDNVDLPLVSFLNASQKHNDNMVPLWRRSNLEERSKDCYYEFEVQDEQDVSDNETYISSTSSSSYSEAKVEMSSSFCFICNINVPLPYTRAHVNSPKHKAFLKIAETALERVKKQMHQNYAIENPVPSMYFCPTCVIVIPLRDKSHHDRSKAHQNAKKLDILLQDLLSLYSDEAMENDAHDEGKIKSSKSEKLDEIINKTVKSNVIKTTKNMDTNMTSLETPVNGDTAKEIVHDQKPTKKHLLNKFEMANTKTKVNDETNIKEYLNFINSFTVSTHKVHDINEKYLKIETINGQHLKVTFDNFHGIIRIYKCMYQCMLCVTIVKNKNEHIYSTGHMEKITLPIKNGHAIRGLGGKKYHCILCNEFIGNIDSHINKNEVHQSLLNTALTTIDSFKNHNEEPSTLLGATNITNNKNDAVVDDNGKKQTEEKPKKPLEKDIKKQSELLQNNSLEHGGDKNITNTDIEKFCNFCFITIDTNSVDTHSSSEKHKLNEKCHYFFKFDAATYKLKCKVCDSFVHNDLMVDHIKSQGHADRYKALLTGNKMTTNEMTKNVHCEVCSVYMRLGNEFFHIASTKHSNLLVKGLDEIINIPLKDSNDNSAHFCDICQVNVPNNAHNITTHYKGKSHNKQVALRNSSSVKEDEKTIDKNSSQKLPNVTKNTETKVSLEINKIKENIDKVKVWKETMKICTCAHMIDAQRNIYYSKAIKQDAGGNNDNKSFFVNEKSDIMQTTNQKELMCKICNVIIPNKTINITEHLIGQNHVNNIRVLLKENQLKLIGNLYFCDRCSVFVNSKEQFIHINKPSHVEKMPKTVANTVENYFNDSKKDAKIDIPTSKSAVATQSNTVNTEKNTHKFTYFELKITDEPHALLCLVCNVKVPSSTSTMKTHVEGKRHISQLAEILLKHKIKEENGKYECSVCFIELTKFEMLQHIRKRYHLAILERSGSNGIDNNNCNICGTVVARDEIEQHILSEQHLTKQKEQLKSNMCEICDVRLSNNTVNINEHNNGLQHKSKIKLLEANNIEVRDKECYCKSCDEAINYKSIQEHIQTSQHLMLKENMK